MISASGVQNTDYGDMCHSKAQKLSLKRFNLVAQAQTSDDRCHNLILLIFG